MATTTPPRAGRALTVMTEIPSDWDVAELRQDIHGDIVVNPPQCDYCGRAVAIDQPVLYEVVRIADMPNLEQLFAPPTDWFADALRCHRCDIDAVSPATEGFDEALVCVNLAESNEVVSIDASSLTVVDCSPVDAGFYPPMVSLAVLEQTGDLGLGRWARVQGLFEYGDQRSPLVAAVREAVEFSREIPIER